MVYSLYLMLLPKLVSKMFNFGLLKSRGNGSVICRNGSSGDIVTILVGNKCDMVGKREVSEE